MQHGSNTDSPVALVLRSTEQLDNTILGELLIYHEEHEERSRRYRKSTSFGGWPFGGFVLFVCFVVIWKPFVTISSILVIRVSSVFHPWPLLWLRLRRAVRPEEFRASCGVAQRHSLP